jgi:hypothetical protein
MASRTIQQNIQVIAYALTYAVNQRMMAVYAGHVNAKRGYLMNTERKGTKVLQCVQCPNVYMLVGTVAIGLAYPRPVTLGVQNGKTQPLQGTCPNHRKVNTESWMPQKSPQSVLESPQS